MANKIFITGPHTYDKLNIAKKIAESNDNLSIGGRFTNDTDYKDLSDGNYIYYMSTQSIDLTYKNNFMLFVNTNNYISTGITMDTYYNSDIFVMEIDEFNNISDNIFKSESNDIIVVWIDSSYDKNDEFSRLDLNESIFLEKRLITENIKYLYFFNDDEDTIVNTVIKYLEGNDEERENILTENN